MEIYKSLSESDQRLLSNYICLISGKSEKQRWITFSDTTEIFYRLKNVLSKTWTTAKDEELLNFYSAFACFSKRRSLISNFLLDIETRESLLTLLHKTAKKYESKIPLLQDYFIIIIGNIAQGTDDQVSAFMRKIPVLDLLCDNILSTKSRKEKKAIDVLWALSNLLVTENALQAFTILSHREICHTLVRIMRNASSEKEQDEACLILCNTTKLFVKSERLVRLVTGSDFLKALHTYIIKRIKYETDEHDVYLSNALNAILNLLHYGDIEKDKIGGKFNRFLKILQSYGTIDALKVIRNHRDKLITHKVENIYAELAHHY